MPILDEWLRDMPQQFLGQPKIEALISAFARQLQEVEDVFAALDEATDLETATGRSLDYLGSIIPLSRKEAGLLAGLNNPEYVISDERYRQYLKYQLLVNTSECTCFDIVEAARMFWDGSLRYTEPPEEPASFHLDVQIDEEHGSAETLLRIPMLRSAGVGAGIHVNLPERECELRVGGCVGLIVSTPPGNTASL